LIKFSKGIEKELIKNKKTKWDIFSNINLGPMPPSVRPSLMTEDKVSEQKENAEDVDPYSIKQEQSC